MTAGQKAYRAFLKTAFWLKLAAEKKQLIGKCEKCEETKNLHAHHVRYPKDWNDTTLEDLQVLCKFHHDMEHFGMRYYYLNGRPWDEEWLIDLTGRLFRRLSRGCYRVGLG